MESEKMPEIDQERHERLCAYVFGELQGPERAEFERELLRSPELRAEQARLEATIGLVKRAIPDEGLSAAVRRDVVASARRSRFRFLSGRRMLSLAAACVVLLGGGALLVRELGGSAHLGSGSSDVKVARRNELDGMRTMEARPEEWKKAEAASTVVEKYGLGGSRGAPATSDASDGVVSAAAEIVPPMDAEVRDALRAFGYSAGDRPSPTAEVAPEVARNLEGLGYGGGEVVDRVEGALTDRFGLATAPSEEQAGEPEVFSITSFRGGTTGGTPVGVGAPEHKTGRDAFLGHGEKRDGDVALGFYEGYTTFGEAPTAPGRGAPGSGPTTPGPNSPDPAEATTRGAFRSAGTTTGATGPAAPGYDTQQDLVTLDLEAIGYGGSDDDERADDTASRSQRERVLTREEVAVQVDRLLDSTRPAPDESPRDMFFRYWGERPFVSASEEHVSTFAVDVDTASYALARSYLNGGRLPPREAVRTEEFVNYFKADQAPPSDGKPFAIGLELAPTPFATDTRTETLRVTVRAKEIPESERKPVALTFVIDNSGSMADGDRLELVKRSLALLLRQLYAGDSVAVVKFSNSAAVVTPSLPANRRGELESLIQSLPIEGGTNVEAGLRLGYEQALERLQPGAVNRVVLCSDGVGNIGETSAAGLLALVENAREKGVYLNTVGVGMGNHDDAFLEQLADRGDGVCNYVDSDAEAKRVFVDGLASALQPVARDVKIQVELDPEQVESWRLLGYENRALENRMFRDDKIDAGEVHAGHQVSALYELVRRPGRSGALATVRVRWKTPHAIDSGAEGAGARSEAEVASEVAGTISSADARPGFQGASNGFQRAVLVAQLAEVLRDSVHARGDSLATLVSESRRLAGTLGDPDFTEFVALLAKANPLLDARAARHTPAVQELLDELALAQFDLARRERTRELDAEALKDPADALEGRIESSRDAQRERDEAMARARDEQALRQRIGELEAAVRAELGQGTDGALAPQTLEKLRDLGYGGD